MGEAWNLDTSVVFGDNPDVVFNDTFAEILPSLESFGVIRVVLLRIVLLVLGLVDRPGIEALARTAPASGPP